MMALQEQGQALAAGSDRDLGVHPGLLGGVPVFVDTMQNATSLLLHDSGFGTQLMRGNKHDRTYMRRAEKIPAAGL
jgi:hypothetical protein